MQEESVAAIIKKMYLNLPMSQEVTKTDVAYNLKKVRDQMRDAAARAGRDAASIRLVAVSKGHGADIIRQAAAAGQTCFGENYVQSLTTKAKEFPALEWHFIGHLQKNKINTLLPHIRCLQTIDSWALAEAVDRRLPQRLEGLIEVHLGGEATKSGCDPKSVIALVEQINRLDHIALRGLMVIPPFLENPEESRPYFRQIRTLLEEINRLGAYKTPLTELSMGMSHDFGVAIEEGATLVRIGAAIFGPRV